MLGAPSNGIRPGRGARSSTRSAATSTVGSPQLRDLAHGIYPAVLESDGLPAALADAARRARDPHDGRVQRHRALRARDRGRRVLLLPRGAAERRQARRRGCPRHRPLAARERVAGLRGGRRRARIRPAAAASEGGLQNMIDRIGALGGRVGGRLGSGPGDDGTRERAGRMIERRRGWVQQVLTRGSATDSEPDRDRTRPPGPLVSAITVALMVVVVDGYMDLSRRDFWLRCGCGQVCALLGPGPTAVRVRGAIREMLTWSGAARNADNAPRAWHTVAAYPATICRGAIPVDLVLLCASVAFVPLLADLPAWTMPLFALTWRSPSPAPSSWSSSVLNSRCGPCSRRSPPPPARVRADAPRLVDPRQGTASAAGGDHVAAIAVGGFAEPGRRRARAGRDHLRDRDLIVGAIATAIFFIVTRSALDPVVELKAATERARRGRPVDDRPGRLGR